MKYLHKFDTKAAHDTVYNGSDYQEPWVAKINATTEVTYNKSYAKQYMTTVALDTGTISFNIYREINTNLLRSISYSTDNGKTWNTTQNIDNKSENILITVNVNSGDKILWKGDADSLSLMSDDEGDFIGSFFSSTINFNAEGNIMSLLYGDNFTNQSLESDGAFCNLFSDYFEELECLIVNAKDLILPATTLTNYCYGGMFWGCTSLITAPKLPATILAEECYLGMFNDCTSLTIAPELLPATTLARSCYDRMFSNCRSLTIAPELPATTLTNYCYYLMFNNCRNLTIAPELPATVLALNCYTSMFWGCTNLNYIKAMFTTTPSTTYTASWVSGVASTGTFVKNSAATWNVTGNNGIPTGWTVQTASV